MTKDPIERLEVELKEAIEAVIKKYPADMLTIYNTLQSVSYSILLNLEKEAGVAQADRIMRRWERC